MKFLVISGAPETGKTTSINKIAEWLTVGMTTDIDLKPLPPFLPNAQGKYNDFSIVINRHGRKIIVHSATDDNACMNGLIDKLKKNPDAEVVITSCRDYYKERDYFTANVKPYAIFFLESPQAKIPRRNNHSIIYDLHKNNLFIMHKHILTNNPYNL